MKKEMYDKEELAQTAHFQCQNGICMFGKNSISKLGSHNKK